MNERRGEHRSAGFDQDQPSGGPGMEIKPLGREARDAWMALKIAGYRQKEADRIARGYDRPPIPEPIPEPTRVRRKRS